MQIVKTPPLPAPKVIQRPSDRISAADREEIYGIICPAVEAGKPLTKSETARVNAIVSGKPVGVFVAEAHRFARAVAAGEDVANSSPDLLRLLQDGPAAALMNAATARKALADAFEKTGYFKRVAELKEACRTALEAFQVAEADEDTSMRKIRRLQLEHEQSIQRLSDFSNTANAEFTLFRREMKKTADLSKNELLWQNFLI